MTPSFVWPGVMVRFADADESDLTEDSVTAGRVVAEEDHPSLTEEGSEEVNPLLCRNMRMSTEPGYFEPILKPVDAKNYVHSAAPMSRKTVRQNVFLRAGNGYGFT